MFTLASLVLAMKVLAQFLFYVVSCSLKMNVLNLSLIWENLVTQNSKWEVKLKLKEPEIMKEAVWFIMK